MTLDLSNVVNVSLTGVPQGLEAFNVNTPALFSNDSPGFVEEFRSYLNAREVATDFGSDSLTAKMAEFIFSQSPNILSGDGSLTIIPLQSSVSATFGSFVTDDISANVAGFKTVTDGEFAITLNGVTQDVTGLDFSNITTIDDIATVIKKKLLDVFIAAATNSTSEEETITFTSKKAGASSAIAFSSVSGGTGTDITGATYLNTTAGIATAGVDSSGETIKDAIIRTEEQTYYNGTFTTLIIEDDIIEETAAAIQARNKMFVHAVFSSEDIAGIGTTIKAASYTKTRLLLYTNGVEDAQLFAAGYVGRGYSVNFNGSNTSQTLNLKAVAGVTPDPGITQTIKNAADTAGLDMYVSYAGVSSIVSTGGNNYFDNVYSDIWLKLALQVGGFNYLVQTNTKIPQTEAGMDGLKGAYAQVLERAIINGVGGIGLTWNSSETFGNPEDLRRNITEKGYYVYSLPIAQQSQSDRIARKAPLVQIAFKRAGAIHSSDVIVVVED